MIRIICPECKNAYLQKADADFTCPGCNAQFPEGEENFLAGAQYYHEGDYAAASDCLMKYIVKNGAEPRAIFYKALCDAQKFDEDTASLKDLYVKVLESLMEISDDDFVRYLAMANDEVLKVERALTQIHLELFADADAEKIKREVSAIIRLQDEAKIYRNKLNEFASSYNENATNKISVRFSACYFVDPAVATEIGIVKFNKIVDSINSHTVFTGILSNEIKNLEIYYRCIVMFFEKNRQKYEFLMASADKFSQIAKLLEEGRYASIKGVPTICEKLKAAAYDFFHESLRDHDDEFAQQTETVLVIVPETVEIPVEATEAEEAEETNSDTEEFEDVYSSSNEEITEAEQKDEEADNAETEESAPADEDTVVEIDSVVIEEATETEEVTEAEEVIEAEEAIEAEEVTEVEEVAEAEEVTEVEEVAEAEEVIEVEEVAEAEEVIEAEEVSETEEANNDSEKPASLLKAIAENGFIEEEATQTIEKASEEVAEAPKKQKRKHKKSIAPIIAVVALLLAVIALIGIKVIPAKINESNYEKAGILFNNKNYEQAAVLYEKLGEYEDSAEKYKLSRYLLAGALEAEKKFDEAKEIYISLGDYEDSVGKVTSCEYQAAIKLMENKEYDKAITAFKALGDYATSPQMIDECNYHKAVELIVAKDYEKAIEMLTALTEHPDKENKILEAKYGYVTENYTIENETTLSYLKDLATAKYKDSGDLRNQLLGTNAILAEGISACINYSETDTTENLEEVGLNKAFYYHVTISDESLYNKRLTVTRRTSAGYGFADEYFVPTAEENTYTLKYNPADSSYGVTFSVLSDDNTTLITQDVMIK